MEFLPIIGKSMIMSDRLSIDYNTWALEDFLSSPKFIDWVWLQEPSNNTYWQKIQEQYPEKAQIIAQAKDIISSFSFHQYQMDEEDKKKLWKNIITQSAIPAKTRNIEWSWRIAAALLLLIGLSFVVHFIIHNNQTTIQTAYGQLNTISLPDGSIVRLNGNSRLQYSKNWKNSNIREVWLNGGAFFEIKHIDTDNNILPHERFLVHTDGLIIEVLGTVFDVRKMSEKKEIHLFSGKVRVSDNGASSLILKPGETSTYNNHLLQLNKNTASSDSSSISELHFDHTSLKEVFAQVQNLYGWTPVFKDNTTAERTISGTFHIEKESSFFQALSIALGITISKDSVNHKIYIQ